MRKKYEPETMTEVAMIENAKDAMDKEARLEYFRYGYEKGFKEAYRIIMSDMEKAVKISLPRKMKEYEDIQIFKGGKPY